MTKIADEQSCPVTVLNRLSKSEIVTTEKSINFDIFRSPNFLAYLGIFFIALILRLWFAFLDGHSVIFNACDASEYIAHAEQIQEFLKKPTEFWILSMKYLTGLLTPEAMSSLRNDYQLLDGVSNRSGPVYPLFLFLTFSIFHVEATTQNLFAPIIVQSIVTSTTCVLIGYTGSKLWDRRAGISAALLSVFYPGFIINGSRLVSESLAAFMFMVALCLTVKMIVERRGNIFLSLLAGLSLGTMQLIRSAMLLVSLVFLLCSLNTLKLKRAKRSLIVVFIGFCLPLFSFACLQNLVNGTPSIVVNRLASYNLFTGLDLDAKGWLAFPYPNYGIIEKKSLPEIIKQQFDHSPKRFLELLLDKPPRLFAFHWNDFKTPIGVIKQPEQIIYHQICFLLASIGLSIGLFLGKKQEKADRYNITSRTLVLGSFLAHFAYCAFITLPRYGLTAMPCVLLFAGAGLSILINLTYRKDKSKLAFTIIAAMILVLLSTRIDLIGLVCLVSPLKHPLLGLTAEIVLKVVAISFFTYSIYKLTSIIESFKAFSKALTVLLGMLLCLFAASPLNAYGGFFEWTCNLERKNDKISTSLNLPADNRNNVSRFFLLLDSPNWQTIAQSTKILLNGEVLQQPIIPLMALVQYNKPGKQIVNQKLTYDLESITSSIALALGGKNLDLRQWFIIPIPEDTIFEAIENGNGDLSLEIENVSNNSIEFYGNYVLKKNQVIMPGLERYSFEKAFYGIENNCGLSDIRYENKIGIKTDMLSKADLSNDFGLQTGFYNFRLLRLDSHPNTSFANGTSTRMELVQKEDGRVETRSKTLSLSGKSGVTILTFELEIESRFKSDLKTPINMTISIDSRSAGDTKNNSNLTYTSQWTPSYLILGPGINQVRISVPIHTSDWKTDSINVRIKADRCFGLTKYSNQFYSIKDFGILNQDFKKAIEHNITFKSIKIRTSSIQNFTSITPYKIY